jgi:hypothetical protein
VAKAARELQKDKGRGTIKSAEWSESDRLLMFHSKIYVPRDRELRHRIIKQHHNTHIARLSGELPLTYLPLDPFLVVYFYSSLSSLSILYSLTSSTSTGSISSDCDRYGHSHVM